MNQEDQLKEQLDIARERMLQLEKQLEGVQRQTAQILNLVESQQTQLAAHESSIARRFLTPAFL